MWPEAARRGISRARLRCATRAASTPDLRIMDLLDAQPEFTKAFWDYLDLLVTDERIARGREMLAQHAPTFDGGRARLRRRPPRHRGDLGRRDRNTARWPATGPVIRSTATLACVGRRQAYFTDEFLAALEILQRGDIRPEQLKGSWAGAFGPTQFMPTAFKRYAVDFDGDGRRDVVGLGARRDRLDRQQSEEGRLGQRRRPGATRSWCRRASISCSPTARGS